MFNHNVSFQCRRPSLQEKRGDRVLLVWGNLGQWLVLDDEAWSLLQYFAEKQTILDALKDYARGRGVRSEDAQSKSMPIIEQLAERGILFGDSKPILAPPDKLQIANLTFNITNQCNLRCPWCYNICKTSEEIPIREFMKWLRQGIDAFDKDASFIILGGEPFLDPQRLSDTIAMASGLFAGEILVSTNGTVLDEQTLGVLAEVGATVQVSIDSPKAECHDTIRGPGVFKKSTQTAQRLVSAGIHTVLSMVLVKGSEDDLESYFDLAMDIGVQEVRFIPLRQIGKGQDCHSKVPDLYAIFSTLVSLLQRRSELAPYLGRDFYSILMAVCRHSLYRSNCGIGRRVLFVDADGKIYPCPNHRTSVYCCGQVPDVPLNTVLEDAVVLKSIRREDCLKTMTKCCTCSFRYWCAGDCRAEATFAGGDARAPSPYCESLQKIMKEIFWLIADGWGGMRKANCGLTHWV